jgi:hypothetical protein
VPWMKSEEEWSVHASPLRPPPGLEDKGR